MAQLNLYVSEDTAAKLRAEASREGVSLSRYVAALLDSKTGDWPADFFSARCGFLGEELPAPADPLPEPVECP
jgi:hypothetical protein